MIFDEVMSIHRERGVSVDVRSLTRTVDDTIIGRHADGYDVKVDVVNVMSKSAGGSVRTYIGVGGILLLALPAYPRKWPELDDWVSEKTREQVIS